MAAPSPAMDRVVAADRERKRSSATHKPRQAASDIITIGSQAPAVAPTPAVSMPRATRTSCRADSATATQRPQAGAGCRAWGCVPEKTSPQVIA